MMHDDIIGRKQHLRYIAGSEGMPSQKKKENYCAVLYFQTKAPLMTIHITSSGGSRNFKSSKGGFFCKSSAQNWFLEDQKIK